MYGVYNNRCPSFISDVIQSTKTTSTHSADTTNYVIPRLRTKFAERGFAYAWNHLPESPRRTPSNVN